MLEVRANHNRNVVCVFNRGPKVTYYLGLDRGPYLNVCELPNEEFERHYSVVPERSDYSKYSPLDFAIAYMRDESARKMVPLTPVAIRVLTAIIAGQPTEGLASETLNSMESIMASAKEESAGFRKPDGPVAKIHKFLDGKLEAIKAGTVSRKELIEALVAKDYAQGTVVTQCGVWARTNGVAFARPAQAAETKKEVKAKAKKKAAA